MGSYSGQHGLLITHGPPYLRGDRAIHGVLAINVGCEDLYYRTRDLPLQLHVLGHIHEGYGMYRRGEQVLINTCTCTEHYEPTNKPVVFIAKPASVHRLKGSSSWSFSWSVLSRFVTCTKPGAIHLASARSEYRSEGLRRDSRHTAWHCGRVTR